MREIKFRAWSNRDKCWCGAFSVHKSGLFTEITGARLKNGVCVAYADWIDLAAQDEITLMQYTGLKDKNGKEIYEGDVVQEDIRRDKRSKPIMRWSVVVYSEKGMFIVECLPKSLRQWNELYKENDEVEVIGNIYENPELLNPLTR